MIKMKTGLQKLDRTNRRAVVLLVTLVMLVVMATLAFIFTSRVAAERYRNQYVVDYQIARYSCDSAAKYALATLEDINDLQIIARPNEPDFSDIFTLSRAEYREFVTAAAIEKIAAVDSNETLDDVNDVNDINDVANVENEQDADSIKIRGPYGPAWPLIIEPVEFEIGKAKVRIEIEDENAKYPLGWVVLGDKDVKRQVKAGFETFCEWMDVSSVDIRLLQKQLKVIGEIKKFKMDFQPIKVTEQGKQYIKKSERIKRRKGSSRLKPKTKTLSASVHRTTFAKLFHSSLLDIEPLARSAVADENSRQAAIKYMAMFGSDKVNINTAPRQVLESAFTFGGDADRIAEEIIQRRRIEPFVDMDDLKKKLMRYSVAIEKCEKYITTTSNFFTIRATATSGVATASTVIAVIKGNEEIQRIATISN